MSCDHRPQLRPYWLAAVLFVAQVFLQLTCSGRCDARPAETFADSELEDLEIRAAIHLSDKNHQYSFNNLRKRNEEISQVRATCASRLKAGLLPDGCFRALRLEKDAKLLDQAAYERELAWIKRLCVNRARSSSNWSDLQAASEDLPIECKKAADGRLSELRYQEEEKDPARLFSRRHSPGALFESVEVHEP